MTSEEEVFEYLTNLRNSGSINMLGAIPYLMEEFSMERDIASQFFGNWQVSLTKPHCKDCE